MSNLGEQAMEILNELHTERLAYESEYIPLADAANLLAEYERTGMDPEAIERMQDAFGRGLTLRTDARERLEIIKGLSTDRLRELVEADRNNEFQRHLNRFDIMSPKMREKIPVLVMIDEQSEFTKEQWEFLSSRFLKVR